MRLHFLRLRPKLAVSAFLIGVVPLLLLGLLAAMMLYTGLGGARASGAGAILESWREVAAGGSDLAPALFDTVFTWPDRGGRGGACRSGARAGSGLDAGPGPAIGRTGAGRSATTPPPGWPRRATSG